MDSMGSLQRAFSYSSKFSLIAPRRILSLCFPLTLFHLNRIAASLKSVQIRARIFLGILVYPGGWNILENTHILEKGSFVKYSQGLETVLVLLALCVVVVHLGKNTGFLLFRFNSDNFFFD